MACSVFAKMSLEMLVFRVCARQASCKDADRSL